MIVCEKESMYTLIESRIYFLLSCTNYNISSLIKSVFMKLLSNPVVYSLMHKMYNYDKDVYTHCVDTSIYCILVALELKLCYSDLLDLAMSGLLHDIGKIQIECNILNKVGRLTREEFNVIKTHCMKGYLMIESCSSVPDRVKVSVLRHHEKLDGSGYPDGVNSFSIERSTRILTICDIYSAITTKRSYHEPVDSERAVGELRRLKGKLDINLIDKFENTINKYL